MTMRKGIASTDREDQEEDEPQEDSRMSGAGDIIGRSSSVLHSDIWESLWKTERVVVLREEEDRDIAAALRASIASHLEQRSHVQERSSQKPRKEEKMEPDDMRNNRGTAKQTNDMQGMAIKKESLFVCLFESWWSIMFEYISARSVKNNVPLAGQDFPVLGAAAPPSPIQRYVCSVFSKMVTYVYFSHVGILR